MSQTIILYDENGRRVPLMVGDTPLQGQPIGGPAPGATTDSELTLDLRAIWSAVYRNRLLILIVLVLAVAAGIAATMLTTPIYQATASVQIEQQASRVLEGQDDTNPGASTQDADRFLQTQLDVLRSRALAERVAQSLNLYNDNRFLIAMGANVSAGTGAATNADNELRRQVVGLIMKNMDVTLPRDSRVATITFDSPDPAIAQKVVNSYAENFIISNLQRKYDASSYARNFLQTQLADAKRRLEEAERASIAYARSAQLIDASAGAAQTGGEGPKSLVTASLVQLNQSLSGATAARIEAEQRWRQAQATPVMSLPEVQNNPTIQQLNRQRAEQQALYEQERTRRKEDYPTVQQAKAQLAELDRQIARIAGEAKASIRDRYLVAQRQEASLRGTLGSLKGETLAEQDRSVRFNILRREVDTSRTLYDGLLQRFREVSAAAGVAANNISIVDLAEQPRLPISPRPMLNLALAILGGLTVAMLLIFLRETFDDAIRSAEDIDRKLAVSFLGSVPLLPPGDTPKEALEDVRSAFSEAHYAIRSSLEFATPTGLPRTILLTSSQQSEGKSTSSVAIAKSFARIGKRVLLIDGDLRKPSLHRVLNTSIEPGLSNVLTRQMTIEQVIQETDTPNLSFIPCGPLPPNPAELLASASVRELTESIRRIYDLVLIDGPPVMGLADAPILSTSVEGVVFVIEANRSHRGQAKAALRRLKDARANIVGLILTKFDARAIGYGYNYGYGYGYVYGEQTPPNRWLPWRGNKKKDADLPADAA